MSRILQIRSSTGLYGADRMVLGLNAALNADGVDSTLFSLGVGDGKRSPLHDAAVATGQPAALLECNGRVDMRTVGLLRRHLAGHHGILHAHEYKSVAYAWMSSRGTGWKRVATVHGWVDHSRAMRLYTRLELSALRHFDAVIAVSRPQVERLIAAGIDPARIHHIANGASLPALANAAQRDAARSALHCEDPDTWVIAAVGRLSPEKNIACLLLACSQLPAHMRIQVLIAGDGPEAASLRAMTEQLGLADRVRFLGVMDDVTTVYHAADVVVMPSLTEGMPLVVLEAMSAGRMIFATDVGDIGALLAHAPESRLLPSHTPEALAQLLQAQHGRRVTDLAAREYVLHNHTHAAMARSYRGLYQQLMEGSHASAAR